MRDTWMGDIKRKQDAARQHEGMMGGKMKGNKMKGERSRRPDQGMMGYKMMGN